MRKIVIVVIILFFSTSLCFAASKAKREVKKGNVLYNEGKFEDALKQYEEAFLDLPDSDIVNFNLGAALYKTEDYEAAVNHFEKSLVSDEETLEQTANYNMGNAEYKYGIGKEESDLEEAIRLLKRALKHYERAMVLDPEDEDAKYNYEFVKKELERLEKKTEEEKKEKPEEKEKEDKESESQDGRGQEPKTDKEKEPSGEEENQEKGREDQSQEAEEQKEEEKQDQPQKPEDRSESDKPRQRDQNRTDENGNPTGGQSPKEMSEEEASMLLENYRHEEEPKGLYKEKIETRGLPEVLKDW
ncbi:MAG: tetratricopeptide repeat protein [Candidatus Omnitrophota bacterium]